MIFFLYICFPIFESWTLFTCVDHEPLGLERSSGTSQLPRHAMLATAIVLASAFFFFTSKLLLLSKGLEYPTLSITSPSLCHKAIALSKSL